jgi:hypothetical protein
VACYGPSSGSCDPSDAPTGRRDLDKPSRGLGSASGDTAEPERHPRRSAPLRSSRALASHARTQDALADAVTAAGFVPRSPVPGEPVFDIAWEDGDTIVVAEIKSLTERNEEKQLRLALGQVLRYAHLLGVKDRPVRRVIAVEWEPSDASWTGLCAALGVALAWPDTFGKLFAESVAA